MLKCTLIEKQNYFNEDNPVILFDGVCGLCNSFINIIIKLDKKEIFRYASLQSNAAEELRKNFCGGLGPFDTIILIDNGCHIKAFAIRRILKRIKKLYPFYLLSKILPAFIINYFYDVAARNRYKIFGRYKTCRIPNERERRLFLDY